MTCAAGEARCQEKKCTGKMPCQPNFYISYNNDTCFVRASRMLLIWLKDSCQDYYRRVNMSHSDSTPMFLCSFSFESSSTESEEGTVFILRFFSFLVPRGKGLTLQYWRQHSIFPICPGIRQQREDIVCHMLEITSKREIKSEYGHNLKKSLHIIASNMALWLKASESITVIHFQACGNIALFCLSLHCLSSQKSLESLVQL